LVTTKRIPKVDVPLRLVVLDPPPGVTFAVQHGRDELARPSAETPEATTFLLSVFASGSRSEPPRLTGPFAQGPPAGRFVYVCSGTLAGQAESCWTRRAKVPLTSITWEHVEKALDDPERVLEAAICGTGRDGGPACASVPLVRQWARVASGSTVAGRESERMREPAMRAKPETIDEYLATLSDDQRAALEKLRRDIRAAAPDAEECISYQLPSFRHGGRHLVSFGAAAKHCAFYPGAIVDDQRELLAGYDTSKGTIRFQPDRPLPTALVRKLVRGQLGRIAVPKAQADRRKPAGKKRARAARRR
jgi:uncharacterized protein YdhG (YjbR/CyaY superfamily)